MEATEHGVAYLQCFRSMTVGAKELDHHHKPEAAHKNIRGHALDLRRPAAHDRGGLRPWPAHQRDESLSCTTG
jgi:hypothetical protein